MPFWAIMGHLMPLLDLLGTTIGRFLGQKGVIVISPDDDHPVPTLVQLVLAILGSRALQMPFLAILEHFDPKRVKKCPKMAKLVQICVIKVDFTHMALFLWENVEKMQKNPNILNIGRVFPVSKVFTAQILSVSQNPAVLFFKQNQILLSSGNT